MVVFTPEGLEEPIELTTFDPQTLRLAAENLKAKAKATWVEKESKDGTKTYKNLTGIDIIASAEIVEPGANADRTEALGSDSSAALEVSRPFQERAMQVVPTHLQKSELETLEESFKLAVRQRELLEEFVRARFKENVHYYPGEMFGGKKKVLSQEGAQLIKTATGLRVIPKILSGPMTAPKDITEQYTIVTESEVFNRYGEKIGGALGSASSHIWSGRAMKYVPRASDPDHTHNVVLKLSTKRSFVAAIRANTAASEFTEDEDILRGIQEEDVAKGRTPKKGFIK